MSRAVAAAPVLSAMAFVLTIYVDKGQVLEALPRPVLVAAGATVIFQIGAMLLLRNGERGAAAALLFLLALLDPRLAVLVLAGWLTVSELAKRRDRAVRWQWAAPALAVMFVFSVLRLVSSPAFDLGDFADAGAVRAADEPVTGPDIFVMLLDGYPRSDTLLSKGYDNSWFERQLESRGFDVARDSHSNYEFTYLVLPTMFHMAHALEIDVVDQAAPDWHHQRRAIREALKASPALQTIREAGYRTVSAGWPASVLTLTAVDDYVDTGGINQFEREVLQSTAIYSWLPELALSHHRDRILGALTATEAIATDPSATFMFTHILSPHVPFVFDRAGQLPQLQCGTSCDRFIIYAEASGLTDDEFDAAYADQVHYLNGRVLDTLDGIIESSPDAAIVVFSDHGMRADHAVSAEWFASFMATRTPGHGEFVAEDARPIEIMSRVLNEYFGEATAVPVDETYYSPFRSIRPLLVERWTGETP